MLLKINEREKKYSFKFYMYAQKVHRNIRQDKTKQTQQNRHTHKSMFQSIFTLYGILYHYGLCSALFIETLTKYNKE